MGIVDDLLAGAGLYVGPETADGGEAKAAARILVTALPGGAGVSLDYEIVNTGGQSPALGHAEHTVIGRADDGTTVMVIAHTHGEGLAILRETDAGVFEPGDGPVPYPLKVVVSMPEPGRLRHAWWYGMPGEELAERDVALVERVGGPATA